MEIFVWRFGDNRVYLCVVNTETRIMKRLQMISVVLLICAAVAGCSSNQAKGGDDEWQTYSNEFFSIDYPPNWHIWQEDVQEVPDSIPDDDRLFSQGIRLGLSSDLASSSYECVIVQKSTMGELMLENVSVAPEDWRDFSIFNSQFVQIPVYMEPDFPVMWSHRLRWQN